MIDFGRDICGDPHQAASREWLVTNGIGGYASGAISGELTRRYHGLLVAALHPPLGRTLLVSKLNETVHYDERVYPLSTNRWSSSEIHPHGYLQLERFRIEGSVPVWTFACADAAVEKRIWMARHANTVYVSFRMLRGSRPLTLTIEPFVNYRDSHDIITEQQSHMDVAEEVLTVRAGDAAYHQGTAWSWLIGPFVSAHLKVYGDRETARSFLRPLFLHMRDHGIGSISEVFDAEPPFQARGCIAQACGGAEVLRAWKETMD